MEVMTEEKQGYKRTEVGMIPEDWVVKKLGDIAPLQRGFDLPKYRLKKGNYPVVYSNGIQNFHNKYMVKGPGVVTGRSGTLGNLTYVADDFWPHNTALWVTEFYRNHPKYIYYLYGYIGLDKFGSGSEVPTLNRNDVHDHKISLPQTLAEQQAIAMALSDVDELIRSLDALIQKKEAIKKGTMQQLLTGNKRLPGFDGEWEVKALGELFEISADGDLNKASFSESKTDQYKYPVYANSLTDKGLYGFYDTYEHTGDKITVTARGTVGKAFYRKENFSAIGRLLVLNPKYNLSGKLLAEIINERITFSKESTGVPQLTAPQISKYEVNVPLDLEEQKAIAQIMSDMDKELLALRRKREKMVRVKEGMMLQLLTGRIRIHGIK